jgi:hypothetical protein
MSLLMAQFPTSQAFSRLQSKDLCLLMNVMLYLAGFEQAVAAENASPRGRAMGGAMLTTAANERMLLNVLLNKLQVGG